MPSPQRLVEATRHRRTNGAGREANGRPPRDPCGLDDVALAARLVAGPRPGAKRAAGRGTHVRLRELLDTCGGLSGVGRATVFELEASLKALGEDSPAAMAEALATAFELGRRLARAEIEPPARLRDVRDVGAWGMARLGALEHEELWLLAVDGQSRLRGVTRVAQGGLHGAAVRVADPLRHALRAAASGFVLVHNHPSGNATPSPEDVTFTHAVARAGSVVGVPLLDHVVVSRTAFASVPIGELA